MTGFPTAAMPAHTIRAADDGDRHGLADRLRAADTASTWSAAVIESCLSSSTVRAAYFVVDRDGRLLGGAGIRPLAGAVADVFELGGVYVEPRHRRRGLATALVEHCMAVALAFGYRQCYAEVTVATLPATRLLGGRGFSSLPRPLGRTGRTDTEHWYLRDL